MGRAQFELGDHEKTLDTYKMACELTPHSITRLQNLGMMTYYSGNRVEAEKILGRTARLGIDSKMFDYQTLVLLAFARLESGDRKGLQHCRDDLARLLDRHARNTRLQRLAAIVDALILIQERQFARAVDTVRELCAKVKEPDFDFESATNLLSLLGQLANKAIQLDDVESVVDTLSLRFCTGRSMSELLAGATAVHPPYAERIHTGAAHILKLAENAMTLSLSGDPSGAVKNLLIHGNDALNAKLIETAYLVLQRYATKITEAKKYTDAVTEWRNRYGTINLRPTLGEPKRAAGGLTLRAGKRHTETRTEAQTG
jgi:hypothetical protein